MVKSLKINGKTFAVGSKTSFQKRVTKSLKGRPDEISFEFSLECTDLEIFEELMKCAAGHGLLNLWVRGSREFMDFSGRSDIVFGSITQCAPSLEYLELEELKFNGMYTFGLSCSGFKELNALHLSSCCFDFSSLNRLDPFRHLPKLGVLMLSSCSCHISESDGPDETRCLEISGDRLSVLEIYQPVGFTEINVSATNLTSFTYKHEIPDHLPATGLSLNGQSLGMADIELLGYKRLVGDEQRKRWAELYANLFHGLRNASSLDFKFDTAMVLWDACNVMGDLSWPFLKLESLTLHHEDEEDIPGMGYFFGNYEYSLFYGRKVILIARR
ncbi:unnamed protein product [Linum trigynum]|uniref:Uncharacterized protein n=1 Tax=Linum trigynum TaxID=586398 RepID=A0AAV2DQB0_9ROSI